MKYTIQVAVFSPTGNTLKICGIIANGTKLPLADPPIINLTSLTTRNGNMELSGDIIIFGSPIYVETMPEEVYNVILKLNGKKKWIIPVAVSGNVKYGNCLQEMIGLLNRQNFKILAAANFVGRHSFYCKEFLIGKNRPDNKDIEQAT